MLNYIKKIRNKMRKLGLIYNLVRINGNIVYAGTEYGGFSVLFDKLNINSIIYSFGIGEDISFDLEIIALLGSKVYAFDPTPKSLEWLKNNQLPEGFFYQEIGLSDMDGSLLFAQPKNPNHVSMTTVLENYEETNRIELPVLRLSTIMDKLGHTQLDVLKMDIEGSEYCVIKDIINSKIDVKQILVEFHHRFKSVGYSKTNEAIKLLNDNGYILFAISDNGEEMSFVRKDSIE